MNKKLIRQVFILFLFFIVNVVCVFPASRAEAKLTAKEKKFFRKVIADERKDSDGGIKTFFALVDVNKDGKEELFVESYIQGSFSPNSASNYAYGVDKKRVKVQYYEKGKLKSYELSHLVGISPKGIYCFEHRGSGWPELFEKYCILDKKGRLVKYAESDILCGDSRCEKIESESFKLKGKEVSEKEFKKAVKKLGKFKEVKYHEASKKNIKKYLGGK